AVFTLLSEWLTQGLTGVIVSERSMPNDGAIVVVVIALLVCWTLMAVPAVILLERLRWKGPLRPVMGWVAASFFLWLAGAMMGGVGPLLFLLFWLAFGLAAGAHFNPAPKRRQA
ncbi:MAG TPA: hypothetical protein VHS06_06450, partial [Chloroflexota bacterium]|nr:hypothetical protein [Chloroflexota bacterium]